MAKMDLEFLLSPSSNNANPDRSSASHASRIDGRLSVDRIAPRGSKEGDKYRSSRNSRHHGRSGHNSRSTHAASKGTTSTASKLTSSKNQGHSSTRTRPGKPRNQDSPPPAGPAVMENRPHVCAQCHRGFYKLEQLKRHHRLVHLNLRPFKCLTCRLSFGTKQNMQVHLTTRKHQHKAETAETERQYAQRQDVLKRNEGWAHYRRQNQHGSSSRHHR